MPLVVEPWPTFRKLPRRQRASAHPADAGSAANGKLATVYFDECIQISFWERAVTDLLWVNKLPCNKNLQLAWPAAGKKTLPAKGERPVANVWPSISTFRCKLIASCDELP